MARLEMKKMRICALKKYRQPLLEELQRAGMIQLVDEPLPEEGPFEKADTQEERSEYERSAQSCRQALEVLDQYAPEKTSMLSSLEGRTALAPEEWQKRAAERQKLEEVARRLVSLSKQVSESHSQEGKLAAAAAGLEPWLGLDMALDFKGTKTTTAFIGSFAGEKTREELLEAIGRAAPEAEAVDVNIISRSKEQTCVLVLCLKRQAEAVGDALRGCGFALPGLPGEWEPAKEKERLAAQMEENRKKGEAARAEILELAEHREGLKLLLDDSTLKAEQEKGKALSMASGHVFWMSGYIPGKRAGALQKKLEESYGAITLLEEPEEEENVPVMVENNGFSAPVEGILHSFSLPGKGEIDPTFMMSLFYYFFFGMMLSDAGYGLVMTLACGICLAKYKNMEPGMRKTLKMFMFSGISTIFWGAMYGSWFGDAPKVIASTFFGSDFAVKPIWMDPISQPMTALMVCMLFGIIHLFAGLGCKVYQCAKNGDYVGIVTDALVWYMLVGGLILFGLANETFVKMIQVSFILPGWVGAFGKWAAILGALGVVVAGGRGFKNPLLKLVNGLYALYGSTSWLGDILSYSRLLGLGLATGVIGQVVNMMGAMAGPGPVGAVVFIIVFVVGHTLNIAINLLGAYVHTNRLEYVEFFGKFFEGGGEPFTPFAVETKYYKMSEVK